MIATAVSIALACFTAFFGAGLPDSFWYSYLPLVLFCAWFTPRYRFLLLFAAAYLWAAWQLQLALDLRLAPRFDQRIVLVTGLVAELPEIRKNSTRLVIQPEQIAGYNAALPARIRINWYRNNQQPRAGERWQLLVKLRRPRGYQNPAGFDYQQWMLVQGIGASGYIKTSSANLRLEAAPTWSLNRWRGSVQQNIQQACQGCRHAGLISALTIGYRGAIPDQTRRRLQDSGTAHLLAISGLHIGIIAALFFAIGRGLWHCGCYRLGTNRNAFGATLGMAAATLYAAFAGFSLPTLRALVMLAVLFLALRNRSPVNLLNGIACAIVILLVADPLAVGASSFWLSITALLIIAYTQYLLGQQQSRWKQAVILQVVFSVLFLPLSLLLFEQLNPASFFANILAIPLVSMIIVPLSLAASLLASLDIALAQYVFVLADQLLSYLFVYLDLLLDNGLAAYQGGYRPAILLLLVTVSLLVLLMPAGFIGKPGAVMLIVIAVAWQRPKLEQGSYKVLILDVGMGTSLVVETRHHSLVYDFGPGNDTGFSSAQWALLPYLRQAGIAQANLYVISHVDQDHSGGFQTFKDDYRPAALVSGTPIELRARFKLDLAPRSCHEYPGWRWDGVEFEFLSSTHSMQGETSNNRSCVLRVQGFATTLLPGDIEAKQEARLLEAVPQKLAAEVLVAPHHGSNTSSSYPFIRQVDPQLTLFTLSAGNRWGFPRQTIVEAYRAQGSRIYRSDKQGAVAITSNARGLSVQIYRQPGRKAWRD